MGVDESTYRKIENGSRNLQLLYYDTISETLDIPYIQLLLSAIGHTQSDRASLKYLYDDRWDDLTYQSKVEEIQYMSKELFHDQPEIRIPKQGPVQDIQNHLYQLQQLLPSMTGIQTYLLRKLCFPYEEETVTFALYRYMNETHDTVEESVIADYLWYFASHDDKYKYMAQHMEFSLVFNALWVLNKNANVEDGFDLLQSLATHDDEIYPFLKHVVPYKFLTLNDETTDICKNFDFEDNNPSEIEKLFEESLSEETASQTHE